MLSGPYEDPEDQSGEAASECFAAVPLNHASSSPVAADSFPDGVTFEVTLLSSEGAAGACAIRKGENDTEDFSEENGLGETLGFGVIKVLVTEPKL